MTLRMHLQAGGEAVAAGLGLKYVRLAKWEAIDGVEGYLELSLDHLGSPSSGRIQVISAIMDSPVYVIASLLALSDQFPYEVAKRAFSAAGRYAKNGMVVELQYHISPTIWAVNAFEILELLEQANSPHKPTALEAAAGWEHLPMFKTGTEGSPQEITVVLCSFGPKAGPIKLERVAVEPHKAGNAEVFVFQLGDHGEHYVLAPCSALKESLGNS